MSTWKEWLGRGWSWTLRVYREFRAEHASLSAAAVALFALLSLFPLALLALSVASYALGDPQEALRRMHGVVSQVVVPQAAGLLEGTLRGVVQGRGAAGALGLLGFLWAGSRVFTILAEAFDMVWDVQETRGFLRVNLLALGLVLLGFAFALLMLVGPLGVGVLVRYSDRVAAWAGVPVRVSGALTVLIGILAYAATIGFFFVLYQWVPNRRVPWRSALLGAAIAGTLWQVARALFQLYLVNFGGYNEVYGALAGVIVLILWLYYSAEIVMAGTIVAAVHAGRTRGVQAGWRPPGTQYERPPGAG